MAAVSSVLLEADLGRGHGVGVQVKPDVRVKALWLARCGGPRGTAGHSTLRQRTAQVQQQRTAAVRRWEAQVSAGGPSSGPEPEPGRPTGFYQQVIFTETNCPPARPDPLSSEAGAPVTQSASTRPTSGKDPTVLNITVLEASKRRPGHVALR